MRRVLLFSLLLNVAVLLPVCVGLMMDAEWTQSCYGSDTPARRILLSIYMALGLCSAALLFVNQPVAIATLLVVQIVYKVSTPLTVGSLGNPVIVSNLAIAAFHAAMLAIAWRSNTIGQRAR